MSSLAGHRSTSTLSDWYCGVSDFDTSEPARAAFQEGLKIFKETLTKDGKKKDLAGQFLDCRVEDILRAVVDVKSHYDAQHGSNKIHESLTAFSKRVFYYGNVIDVLAQHHPEYVSLVWGAMKFLFGAVIEHERTGVTIVSALCDIGDSLPRVGLALLVYPTESMKRAVSMLYAHIVRFLIRAMGYYSESKFARAVHTITRPAALRYDDIIKMIQHDRQIIANHAVASSQAELRDVHEGVRGISQRLDMAVTRSRADHQSLQTNVQTLADLMSQLRQSIMAERAASMTVQMEIRSALSDVQLAQALAMISSQCSIDHKVVLQSNLQLHNRHRLQRRFHHTAAPLWTSRKLREWNASPTSSSILLKSTFHERAQIRGFCTEVIEHLIKARNAVLWVLVDLGQEYPILEILKSLVLQALTLDYSGHSETKMSFQLRGFLDAHFESDYLNMLGELLQHFKLVYIVVSSDATSLATSLQCRDYLRRLSCTLAARGSRTVLKIIATAHGPGLQASSEDIVLAVGRMHKQGIKKQQKTHSRRRQNSRLTQPLTTAFNAAADSNTFES